jgi:hypothetical protein
MKRGDSLSVSEQSGVFKWDLTLLEVFRSLTVKGCEMILSSRMLISLWRAPNSRLRDLSCIPRFLVI